MKKVSSLLLGGVLLILAATGCQQGKSMDDATIAAKADSIYNSKKIAVMDSMRNDCETNMSSWVTMKADSIFQAQSAATMAK